MRFAACASGKIDPPKAELALGAFFDLGIELVTPVPADLDRAWRLRQNISFYDALYVSLAERTNTPLITADTRIAASGAARCAITTVTSDD